MNYLLLTIDNVQCCKKIMSNIVFRDKHTRQAAVEFIDAQTKFTKLLLGY